MQIIEKFKSDAYKLYRFVNRILNALNPNSTSNGRQNCIFNLITQGSIFQRFIGHQTFTQKRTQHRQKRLQNSLYSYINVRAVNEQAKKVSA